MASRTTLFPRNENEMLLTPPLTLQCGKLALIRRVASMKFDGVVIVLLHPGGHGQDIGIEDNVLRGKPDLLESRIR